MRTALICFFCFICAHAYAEEPLISRALETRAQTLFTLVKCPVCEGQSIKDSGADIAIALRNHIRVEILRGCNDDEIIAGLKSAYGNDISFAPEFSTSTFLLWLLPLAIFVIGLRVVAKSR